MYGNSIAQLESDVGWGIITSNPAMADGNALFHTTHKNLAGTGAALAVDAVGAARAAMAMPGVKRTSRASATRPAAWIMRTTTTSSSGVKAARSASARMVAKDWR